MVLSISSRKQSFQPHADVYGEACKRSQAGTQWAHQPLSPSVTASMRKLRNHNVTLDSCERPRYQRGNTFIWDVRTPGELGAQGGTIEGRYMEASHNDPDQAQTRLNHGCVLTSWEPHPKQ